jgi:predicted nucleic acid-binding protein
VIVLDTNVVSEAMRPEPHAAVINWLNAQVAETLHLSSVTLAELLFGIRVLPAGTKRGRLAGAFDSLMVLFPARVLPFDQHAARLYADMTVTARVAGRPLPTADGYLAATAAAHGCAVATRNVQHFRDTGVELINPWRPR